MSQVSNSDGGAKYAIELQGVCKSFRRTQVLSNLTMRVERGKTFAFLGRRIDTIMQVEKAKMRFREQANNRPRLSRFLGRLRYPAA